MLDRQDLIDEAVEMQAQAAWCHESAEQTLSQLDRPSPASDQIARWAKYWQAESARYSRRARALVWQLLHAAEPFAEASYEAAELLSLAVFLGGLGLVLKALGA